MSATPRTAVVWCPDWPITTLRRTEPLLADTPLVVVEPGTRGEPVRAASSTARSWGVAVGMRRREAEAACPQAVVVDADDDAEARAFELVIRAVEGITPRLVIEHPGLLSFPTRGPSR